MKALFIAEKPSLMREVKAVYDKHGHKDTIVFKSFAGHVTSLCEPGDYNEEWAKWNIGTLPMIPERFKYKPSSNTKSLYKELVEEIKNGGYDYLINCCDPDREGEAIFGNFILCAGIKMPVKRFWNSELTEQSIKKSLDNLFDGKEAWLKNLEHASRLRGYFDWLIGLNGTRVVSLKTNAPKAVNIGRVMTPTLRFIVDRELELRNFIPKPFWEVEANFGAYKGIYFNHNEDNETRFLDKKKAETLANGVKGKSTVIEVDKTKATKYAPTLHSLQELQNEASRMFGYSMDNTLAIAQKLYEAKILTYPRTDTGFITTAIAEEIAHRFKSATLFEDLKDDAIRISGDNKLIKDMVKNKKYVDDKKVGGHFGIMPTGATPNMSSLSQEEKNIFYLVCRRLVAIYLPPMVTNKTTIVTECLGNRFKTNGKVLVDIGFARLFNQKSSDTILPDVKKGDIYDVLNTTLIEKKTSPPDRYNDDLLGRAMENAGKFIEDEALKDVMKKVKGIGTPATRGNIVKKLVDLGMIERKKNYYYATDYGISIIQMLGNRDITLPELTAKWEEKLSSVEDGSYNAKDFYKEMITYCQEMIEEYKGSNFGSLIGDKEVLGKCPNCGGDVIESKNYFLCANYGQEAVGKEPCKFTIGKLILKSKVSKTDAKALLAGKETKEKEFTWKSGKKGKAKLKINNKKVEFVFDNSK